MKRRDFLAAAAALSGCASDIMPPDPRPEFPAYLTGYESDYAASPRAAAQAWLDTAGHGLLLRYGVYSQLSRGPSVQFDEKIPPDEYRRLNESFDPSGFDAEAIAELAAACGLRHVGITARNADGYCLFRTIETDFNSLESTGRDLVAELAEACNRRRIGLILSYSYAADWLHPYFFPPDTARTSWRGARPAYDPPQPRFKFEQDEDFLHYVRYAHNQLQEIAYRYESVAGIRFEPLAGYFARPDLFPVDQAYSVVREARPELLVSFGTGATGNEDFRTLNDRHQPSESGGPAADANRSKPLETVHSLRSLATREASGDALANDVPGLSPAQGNRLLVRVDLRPDGSLDPADRQALLASRRLRDA